MPAGSSNANGRRPRLLPIAIALWIVGTAGNTANAAEPKPFQPGQTITAVVDAEMWSQRTDYRGAFPTTGRMIAEIGGLPTDCAVQVGTQGFSASEDSPVDWTDGSPGQTVRHMFNVEAGRFGKIWVMIRSRAASVSAENWTGVSCSATGPWYTLPATGTKPAEGPTEFEGRPVRPPITFIFRAGSEADLSAKPSQGTKPSANKVEVAAEAGAFWYDEALGFGFEIPEGCTVEDPNPTTRRVRAPAGSPLAELVLEVHVVPGGSTAEQETTKIHNERVAAGAELHVMGPVSVAGASGMFAAHVTPRSADRNEHRHADISVRNGPRLYRIIFEGPQDRFDAATEAYRTVVGSFSFQKQRLQQAKDRSP